MSFAPRGTYKKSEAMLTSKHKNEFAVSTSDAKSYKHHLRIFCDTYDNPLSVIATEAI